MCSRMRSRGGFSTKIHALVDGLENLFKFILTPRQKHEISQADVLIEGMDQSILIADKGYEDAFICNTKTRDA